MQRNVLKDEMTIATRRQDSLSCVFLMFFDVSLYSIYIHIEGAENMDTQGPCKELCFELTIPINASIPCESILRVCEYICSKENCESYIGMKSLFKYCTMCFCRDV